MKIAVVSDLHLESQKLPEISNDFDILIAAGDIMAGRIENAHKKIMENLAILANNKPVLFIPGNHEFETYGINEAINSMQLASKEYPNISFLYNEEKIINNVRFLGSTLWSGFDFYMDTEEGILGAMEFIENHSPDFLYEREDGSFLTPNEVVSEHLKAIEFLKSSLAKPKTHKTVLITHFAPFKESLAENFKNSELNPWFINNLDKKLGNLIKNIDICVHGHTHTSFDYQKDNLRVICNPHGFNEEIDLNEKTDFEKDLFKKMFPELKENENIILKENPSFVSPKIVSLK